jgi:Fe-S cluster assembly iron-binding protein IscA
MTMELSKNAAVVIADHLSRRDEGHGGFRIRCSVDSESSLGLVIGYVQTPMPGDVVVETGSARVFVSADASGIVDSYTLDARTDGPKQRLFLRG